MIAYTNLLAEDGQAADTFRMIPQVDAQITKPSMKVAHIFAVFWMNASERKPTPTAYEA